MLIEIIPDNFQLIDILTFLGHSVYKLQTWQV